MYPARVFPCLDDGGFPSSFVRRPHPLGQRPSSGSLPSFPFNGNCGPFPFPFIKRRRFDGPKRFTGAPFFPPISSRYYGASFLSPPCKPFGSLALSRLHQWGPFRPFFFFPPTNWILHARAPSVQFLFFSRNFRSFFFSPRGRVPVMPILSVFLPFEGPSFPPFFSFSFLARNWPKGEVR